MPFTHLHVHSEYSLLDGACRLRDLVAQAKQLGQTSIAITDHGVMYGAISFYKEATTAGIKPIIGCEVYVAARTRFDMDYDLDSERYHLVLLCKDETGYKNLCRLVSASFTEGFYIKPRIDMELLRMYSSGLICLTACASGEIQKLILAGSYNAAKAKALELSGIFGENGFYLELQDHGLPYQPQVNDGLIKIHNETGIPLVATNDVHYIDRAGAEVQDVLMCIQTGKNVTDDNRMRFDSSELFLKSEAEMRALFPKHPEAFDNTAKIAEICNLSFDFGKHHLPEFTLPKGETNHKEYLKKLCQKGFEKKYPTDKSEHSNSQFSILNSQFADEVRTRLDYELDMIDSMGFTDYFLIVADFIAYAKGKGIPVGPGRGSAAGSVASYCLDITTADPIKYGLYFERFLNPERISMPDIDIDFCERRRGEVLEYVKQKYGTDRVAQIVTFNTLKAKNAVRSVSKALALTFQEENELAAEIPNTLGIKLSDALKTSPRLRAMYDDDRRIKRVIDTAMALEDMPKDSGTHAAGVVITKHPVREYVPLTLSKKDNSIATQYSMTTLEELGLLKMDFLGLRNLTVIDDAVKDIQKTTPSFTIENIPEDDAPTYEMLAQGRTIGVFQMESEGMTNVCVGIAAKSLSDLAAVIALYRPGPMDSIKSFIDNSRDISKIKYLDPALEPILKETYGCVVYQEHIIDILRILGGFSLGQADLIRRAMSKKKQSEIQSQRQTFIEGDTKRGIPGAVANSIPRKTAGQIYDTITPFAGYGFNKSHAIAYAVIAYQTAYLKRHYPHQYMAALLSSVLGQPEKVSDYTTECRAMGIKLLPPDINESYANFSVSGNDLRYGLVAVKNIGRGFISAVVAEREENGPFSGFEEFCNRMHGNELNSRAVESLIKCGCFDGFRANRRQLMMVQKIVLDSIADNRRRNVAGQMDLFGMLGDSADGSEDEPPIVSMGGIKLPNVEEFKKSELMIMEREVTGLYLSGHPMDEHRDAAKKAGASGISDILADFAREGGNIKFKDNQKIIVAGVIESVRTKPTRNNSLMSYLTLDDGFGMIELLAFQRSIDESGTYMQAGNAVITSGRLSARDEKPPQIVIDTLRPITDLAGLGAGAGGNKRETEPAMAYINQSGVQANNAQKDKTLFIKLDSEESPEYERLKLIHKMFPGKQQMVIYFSDTKKKTGAKCIIHDALIKELQEMLGKDNVVVK